MWHHKPLSDVPEGHEEIRLPRRPWFWHLPIAVCFPQGWRHRKAEEIRTFDRLKYPLDSPADHLRTWILLESEEGTEEEGDLWSQRPLLAHPFKVQSALDGTRYALTHPGHVSVFLRLWTALSVTTTVQRRERLVDAAMWSVGLFIGLHLRPDACQGPPEHNPFFLLALCIPTPDEEEEAEITKELWKENPDAAGILKDASTRLLEGRKRVAAASFRIHEYESKKKPDPLTDESLQKMARECSAWAADPSLEELRPRALAMETRAHTMLNQRKDVRATAGTHRLMLGLPLSKTQ